jgi:hypothetical protein
LDTVGQGLPVVISQLEQLHIEYVIAMTSPTRNSLIIDKDCFYVIRQHVSADGVYHLVAAAKMGKEVS